MRHPRPEDPFQCGVDLGEHPAQPIGGCGDLGGQVVVEAGQHREFGDLFLVDPDVAQAIMLTPEEQAAKALEQGMPPPEEPAA